MPFTPRTGPALRHDLDHLAFELPTLIPEFLYAQTATMLVAAPGIGKSIISMQVALSLSSATPLFGTFAIPVPKKVYYLQLEGSYHHAIDRMRLMQRKIPMVAENLCWDMGEGFNILRESDWTRIEQRIESFGKPDLIVLDPIYMIVMGGLSEDRPASAFVRFSNYLMQRFGAATWLNHHSHRPHYSNGAKVEEEDPFYGSQWLKAHLDASWLMQRSASSKVRLDCKKDRNSVLGKRIDLIYHEDSMTCEQVLYSEAPAMTKVLDFLTDCKRRNVTTNFSEIQQKTGVSHAHLRRIQSEIGKLNVVSLVKSSGKTTSWVPI